MALDMWARTFDVEGHCKINLIKYVLVGGNLDKLYAPVATYFSHNAHRCMYF